MLKVNFNEKNRLRVSTRFLWTYPNGLCSDTHDKATAFQINTDRPSNTSRFHFLTQNSQLLMLWDITCLKTTLIAETEAHVW